ncbi:MAG: carbohydrate binding family 9 domain-containing protein [Gemmatimonadota bacterium]|nr:carbohydrate binding family 9 domain-containing protein [Gemmatimonadota bacterium]
MSFPSSLLVALHLLGAHPPAPAGADAGVYNGRLGQTSVRVPRFETAPTIDGRLDEPEWGKAARLTGFSQFSPADGRPADDSTEVLVWYSPTAIHFGVRAFEAHGAVHATLAQRDRIETDDFVQILLGTFNDGRQATVFGVNPLGVQEDGTVSETGRVDATMGGVAAARQPPDLNPDFVYQSAGHVTPWGYEVEIRIPFKSLRYPPQERQRWGINIVRKVQHSGYEDSWTPARRSAASFLGQSGTLEGLSDLRRGVVLDLNPELTASASGSPSAAGWGYDAGRPQLGGNLRWGVTNNLTLNGTIKPDFSQVESDAGQFRYDPRQALFFPEKRPFFLEGIEQFTTPSNLIYTRRIVQPVVAAKLTGKISGTDIALLSAVDDPASSFNGNEHPVFDILRIQRDLGGQSRLGLAYTDKEEGASYNRVGDVDARLVFGKIYGITGQMAGSSTRFGGTTTSAPLWGARFNRSGRHLTMQYVLTGIDRNFQASSGFIPRAGIAQMLLDQALIFYGPKGGWWESVTGDVLLNGTWQYDHFVHQRDAQDKKLHFTLNGSLRGGWQLGAGYFVETFGYDPELYSGYAIERPNGSAGLDTAAFAGVPRIPNSEGFVSIGTPQFAHFSATAFLFYGHDENFYEWASAPAYNTNLTADWRPTDRLRVSGTYNFQRIDRGSDGSTVALNRIPRLKVEYQLSRSVFLRAVGEYDSFVRDSLHDDSQSGAPILIRDPVTGVYVRAGVLRSNSFRADWLFSYQPVPGTVLFAGYGAQATEPDALRFNRLRRVRDGFFLKASYLYRL